MSEVPLYGRPRGWAFSYERGTPVEILLRGAPHISLHQVMIIFILFRVWVSGRVRIRSSKS